MSRSQLALVADNEETGRRSLTEAFNRAATNQKPRQPHAEGALLIAEAYVAQDVLKDVGAALTKALAKSEFEIGPEKDLDRAMAKVKEGDDLSKNCDFSRARHFISLKQMKAMIDLFGEHGAVTIPHEGKEIQLYVVDVDNTVSTPSAKKAGLRNLDVKLLIPFTLETGEETYHISELQFILKTMRKDWDTSHKEYCKAREYADRVDDLEKLMLALGTNSGTAYRRLEAQRNEAADKAAAASLIRIQTNIRNAQKAGVDELLGYQPTRSTPSAPPIAQPANDHKMPRPMLVN